MVITRNITIKAMLAVVAVAVVSVGSFFAGMRYQKHMSTRTEIEVKATDVDPFAAIAEQMTYGIPITEAADNEASWCKAHPYTHWSFGFSERTVRKLDAHIPGGHAVVTPLSGACDALGHVWVVTGYKSIAKR